MKLKRFPLFSSNARGFSASSTSALICASLLGSAALSQAAVIIAEDFSYADGSLDPNNGGTNFSQEWQSTDLNVTTGVATGNAAARRDFSANEFASTGTIWVSFDWGFSATPQEGGSYGGLTFYEDGAERFLIGNTWPGTGHDFWSMNGASVSSESNVGMKTGVARITLGADATSTVDLWVGTIGSPVDVSGAALLTATGRDLAGVDGIRINGSSGNSASQSFDNLLIGTSLLDIDATRSTAVWTNTAGGTWSTAGNWLDDFAGGGSGKTADFNTLNITADATVNLDSALTIGNLVFGDTVTSSAAGWTLANNGNAGNILTLAGATPTITVNALGDTKTVTISAEVAGSAGLTKAGSGTLTLSGNNTYTGTTTISSGTLSAGNIVVSGGTSNLGNETSAVILGAASTQGTLSYTGNSDTYTRGFTIGGAGGGRLDVTTAGQTLQVNTANVTGTGLFTVGGAGNTTINTNLTHTGGLTKADAGTLTLTGANTYSGGTTVNGGRLVFQDSTAGGHNYAANTGATLEFNVTTGNKQLNGGSITGGGTLVKSGAGQLWLGANGSPQTVAMSSGSLIDVQGGLMRNEYGNDGWGGNKADVNVAGGAYLDLWDGNITVDALTGSGTVNKAWSGTHTLTVGVDNGSGTFNGTISNNNTGGYGGAGGGTLNFVKQGTGTQTLTGANSYTGTTTISDGTLQLQGGAFSTTARAYTIATGAVLNLDGNTGVAEGTTTLSGTGTLRITGGTFANETPNEPKGDNRDITMAMGSGAVIDVQSAATMYNGGWQNVTWTNNKADLKADGTFSLADGKSVFVDALTGEARSTVQARSAEAAVHKH